MEDRARDLTAASTESVDVVVIGGGIAGACAAWDAAQRGLKTVLLERGDFGEATSSQSLKILHGGIRYLQHLDVPRLRMSCHERSAFLRIAPHLTNVVPFVVPTSGFGMEGKMAFRAALLLLSLLTPDRNRRIRDPQQRIPLGGTIGRDELKRRFPSLEDSKLSGAAIFYDGQIANPPRLVLAVLQSAVSCGATVINYCSARSLRLEDGNVAGVDAVDNLTGDPLRIDCKTVINAAGPFAAEVFDNLDDKDRQEIVYSRDMAFVVDRLFPDAAALAVQTRYRDPDALLTRGNRHLFMVPWRHYTVIGVNSKVNTRSPNEFAVSEEEIAEFLQEINEAMPSLALTRDDIRVVNSGLLPADEGNVAGGNVSFGKRSIVTDHGATGGPAGLFSAISVRWTMGRATAEDAVNLAEQRVRGSRSACRTAWSPVNGGDIDSMEQLASELSADPVIGRLPPATQQHLAVSYGGNWPALKRLIEAAPELAETLPDSPVPVAEIVFAIRFEGARRLTDVVLRRTDLGSGSCPSDACIEQCARIMRAEMDWSVETERLEIDNLRACYPLSNRRQLPIHAAEEAPAQGITADG